MEITHRLEGSICIVSLEGSLALGGTSKTKSYVMQLLETNKFKGVILNMDRVNLIDSSGMSLLIAIYKRLTENQCQFLMCHVSSKIEKIFKVTGLDGVLKFSPTEADSLRTMTGAAS